METKTERSFQNRELPERAVMGRTLEKWAGLPFNMLERLGSYILVRPTRYALDHLDALSYKFEGTRLKTILEHTLFPLTMVVTLIIGFSLAENGVSIASLATLALIPVIYGLIFAPLERLMPFSRKWLKGGNDVSVDVMMFVSGAVWQGVSKFLLQVLLIISLVDLLEPFGRQIWPSFLPGFVQVLLFLLIKDFFRYWYHRAMHEVPFLWRWHAVHHSVERLYWLNGIRSHPVEIVGQALFYAVPLALLQPSDEIVMVSVLMALSIGIFQHSNIGLKLGIWEYIFSIGDNHRYHHYPNKEVGDSNYGGEFIVWDILFGTFHNPKGERPSDTIGIGTAPNYPMTWAGLMIAPFLPDQKVFGPKPDGAQGVRAQEDARLAWQPVPADQREGVVLP